MSCMLDHHTGQGKRWWRTLLNHGVTALKSLLCGGVTEASMSSLMDFVGVNSSEHASVPPYFVDEEAVSLNNETQFSVTSMYDDEAFACNCEDERDKKLAKGKYLVISDGYGSITDSSEDEYITDDDELKQAIFDECLWHDRELEEWIRFRTPGATFHVGETSGVSTSNNYVSELELLEKIYF